MPRLGYSLSCEEFDAPTLVAQAERAERAGFAFAGISDHFHPWTDTQGESPFVWSVLGAIAARTERLELLTGVTCPTRRIHPVIVAQAAATTAQLMPGRFSLGVGTGEALNEHVTGERWPATAERQDRLAEAIEVIRGLWEGDLTSHRGTDFTVENARLYSLPEDPPPLLVAVAGPRSVELAARKTAHRVWPNAAIAGPLSFELPLPAHFEAAAGNVREEDVAEAVVCGPDPERHRAAIQEFLDAGYENVYVHQVGDDQEGFFDFYEREILPRFG